MKLMNPYFHQGYHLYLDHFYTSVLFKDLFTIAVGPTGTMRENRRDFPQTIKDSKVWAKEKDRCSVQWGRDPPCLALQWLDNKVLSMLTTIDNANVKKKATCKIKTARRAVGLAKLFHCRVQKCLYFLILRDQALNQLAIN